MFLVVLERDQVARPVVPLVVVDVMDDRLWRERPPAQRDTADDLDVLVERPVADSPSTVRVPDHPTIRVSAG
jgi:hypothetical protein